MRLKEWFSNRTEQLINLLYPKFCFGCKKCILPEEKGYLCEECLNKINKIFPPFCLNCGKPIDSAIEIDKCPDCIGYKYYFKRGYTATLYDGLVKDCIHSFKYDSQTHLGETLAGLMSEFALKNIPIEKIDLITAVPLHWKRYRDRGFNQSVILGIFLSKKLGLKFIDNGILRVKAMPHQTGLHRKNRIYNVSGAFKIKRPKQFIKKNILLIDDVFTTGSTLNECSKELLNSGAEEVSVFSLARGI